MRSTGTAALRPVAAGLHKHSDRQRPAGNLWEDEEPRRNDLPRHPLRRGPIRAYGGDPGRNVAGIFERIRGIALSCPSPPARPRSISSRYGRQKLNRLELA